MTDNEIKRMHALAASWVARHHLSPIDSSCDALAAGSALAQAIDALESARRERDELEQALASIIDSLINTRSLLTSERKAHDQTRKSRAEAAENEIATLREFIAEYRSKLTERDRQVEALRRYLRHDGTCPRHYTVDIEAICTCGLDAARRETETR